MAYNPDKRVNFYDASITIDGMIELEAKKLSYKRSTETTNPTSNARRKSRAVTIGKQTVELSLELYAEGFAKLVDRLGANYSGKGFLVTLTLRKPTRTDTYEWDVISMPDDAMDLSESADAITVPFTCMCSDMRINGKSATYDPTYI